MRNTCVKLFLLLSICVQGQHMEWLTDFEKAQSVAKKTDKTILMYFTGSDWCGPCKMLKKDFWQNESFVAQAADFVLLEIDLPFRDDVIAAKQKAYNRELQKKYNKSNSFPTLIAFSPKGKEIDRISAYSMLRDTTPYFAFLDKVRR